ncbi:GNAT family N-acetyltransferase [Bacillus suaedaesalsae]|uniref:GNAT family N-acetyltransferase n=1 Tax=Bacillus suaedaesalsae TaxID=2810349 RepID=A0ABS2DG04_9BACI|nr:GNAT family N-acetyltransferase [Bacillus suaedaesalsae]MBM6617395.1 GNAT family N-acetyltransferase [Bacillus suaedaesalsae]
MLIDNKEFTSKGLHYTIRSAVLKDADSLSHLRLQIDGETEKLDREPGEAFIDREGFEQLIIIDSENERNIFLVVEIGDKLVAFSRCEGNPLKRFSHKVEFGVGVLKEFWGYGIGKNLLKESIKWADENNLSKMTLQVLETNDKAVKLYESLGFEVEGVLKRDKILSDGNYYNTIVMGRFMNKK